MSEHPVKYKNSVGNIYTLLDKNNNIIGNVCGEQTAKLITAAHDLLENLENAIRIFDSMYDDGVDFNVIEEAKIRGMKQTIKKAKHGL